MKVFIKNTKYFCGLFLCLYITGVLEKCHNVTGPQTTFHNNSESVVIVRCGRMTLAVHFIRIAVDICVFMGPKDFQHNYGA